MALDTADGVGLWRHANAPYQLVASLLAKSHLRTAFESPTSAQQP